MTKNLAKIKGFSEIKVEKLKEAARKCSVRMILLSPLCDALLMLLKPDGRKFKTSAELLQERKSCFRLSTGSENWNKILKGGFESRSVSEVYGEYRCGKTQLCHTLCVTAQLPKAQGGGEGKVIVVGKCCGFCSA